MKLRIKEFREQRGMTLARLGAAVEREPSTIFYYENGTINISLGMLEKIAVALECSIEDLLGNLSPQAATPQEEPILG